MCRNNPSSMSFKLFSVTVLTLVVSGQLPANAQEIKRTKLTTEKLEGRIVAGVSSLILGTGVGPKYETFIFELSGRNNSHDGSGKLVRIVHEYFDRKNELKPSFYNYESLYELRVVRKPSCDAKISEFAYEQNGDSEAPTSILKVLEGADRSLIDESRMLTCYVLKETNYRLLK